MNQPTHLLVLVALVGFLGVTPMLASCTKKASPAQCDEMLDRYAELVVKERFGDAGADIVASEQVRERNEAKGDDAFKNCTSGVQLNEHACAMKATTSAALVKCLE
ncbi:MAG: hypothetical protein FWD73_11925 [Polyangiaceae bacterium]|nr:hypothetical protein [Polyangiaceae bacterium]